VTKQEEFDKLADEWRDGTAHHSFWHMSAAHPAHATLLAFEGAVPLVLRRLTVDESINWSFLLCELTGEHPEYEPKREGGFAKFDVHELAEAWLRWGVRRGHLTMVSGEYV